MKAKQSARTASQRTGGGKGRSGRPGPAKGGGRAPAVEPFPDSNADPAEDARETIFDQFKTLVDNLQMGVLVESAERRVLHVNQVFCAQFGIPGPAAIVGADCEAAAREASALFDDPECFVERIRATLSGGAAVTGEELHLKDGRIFERDFVPVRERGRLIGNLWLYRDLTTRKHWEEALRDSELRNLAILNAIPDLMFIQGRDGTYLDFHAARAEMLYVPPERFLGRKVGEIFPAEFAKKLESLIERVLSGGAMQTLEYSLPMDGKEGHFEARIVPCGTDQVLSMVRDITERKRAEADLRGRTDEFAALHETARDLAGQHDLPTLLQTIVERARGLLHAHGGGIYLFDPAQGDLEMVLAVGASVPTGTRLRIGEGLAGQVAQTRQPMIVDDYRAWAGRSNQAPYQTIPFRAVLEAPMLHGGELVGVLVVHEVGDSGRRFDQADADLLLLFAEYAASAVRTARLLQESNRRAEETASLLETSLALTSLDLETTLQTIGQSAKILFAADGCRIFLKEEDGRTLRCVLALQENPVAFSELRITLEEGVAGAVAASGRAEIVNDILGDPREMQIASAPAAEEANMFAPLKERDTTLGVISIRRLGTLRPFQPADLELLKAFASLAASAVSNARLFSETRQRLFELETLRMVSAALRQAHTVQEMIPVFLRHAVQAVGAKAGSLYLLEESSGDWVSQGWITAGGDWLPITSGLRHKSNEGVTGHVGATGELYVTGNLKTDPHTILLPGEQELIQDLSGCISLPLRAETRVVGVIHIWYLDRPFNETEQRLLTSIADMAGNALQRARLHEQTGRQVQRLAALHAVDLAISSSMDLRLTLNILLEHMTTQPDVDAADILLHRPGMNLLEFAAGHGFRGSGFTQTSVNLGDGYAGEAALERRVVHVPDLARAAPPFVRAGLSSAEDFAAYSAVPLIARGQVKGVLEIFHRRPHHPDPEWLGFLELFSGQAAIAIDNAELYEGLQRSNTELQLAYETTIEGWSRALDLRDKETEGHTRRVTETTLRLARAAGMGDEDLVQVRRGALLHDIGKMGVPDHILLKTEALDEAEWAIMRNHPVFAYEMLSPIRYLKPTAIDIPYCHHEKWDGSGYPRGLAGEHIPLAARVFAIADVWDALTSNRPYRPAWTREKALDYIRSQAGRHFDPELVGIFLKLIEG